MIWNARLSQRSSDFSQGYAADNVDFSQIASVLTDQEATVEFIRIQSYDKNFTADSKYAALILTKGMATPKLVVLDNGNQLETRYAKFYRNAIQQKSADTYSYDQFWARVDPALAGKKILYISPDGVYNQISLNTLKKNEGPYLLNQYDLITVGNSKDILELKNRKSRGSEEECFLARLPGLRGRCRGCLAGNKS
jgi:hypothetical protein